MAETKHTAGPTPKGPPSYALRHMVWREGGEMPTVVHLTWEGAYAAACKLAKANPGQRFHVLQTRAIRAVRSALTLAVGEG